MKGVLLMCKLREDMVLEMRYGSLKAGDRVLKSSKNFVGDGK
jgi:hypothetical protein